MNTNQIYISAPMSESRSTLVEFKKHIEKTKGLVANYWNRGRYIESQFDNAGAIVFLLPKMQFKCDVDRLPPGCKNELRRAVNSGKKILIGYRTADEKPHIYEASVSSGMISGIAGTADAFQMRKTKSKREVDEIDDFLGNLPKPTKVNGKSGINKVAKAPKCGDKKYDRRLLLLM